MYIYIYIYLYIYIYIYVNKYIESRVTLIFTKSVYDVANLNLAVVLLTLFEQTFLRFVQ